MKLPSKESLIERYESLSDDQLMEILHNQNNYQEQAVEVAVDIAIKRNMIADRQSIEKFSTKNSGWKLFPEFINATNWEKTRKSITKVLYMLTLFPIIAAVLNHASGKTTYVILYCAIALAWGVITWFSEQRKNPRIIYLHLALFISFITFVINVNSIATIAKLHLLIYLLFFFAILYILLYQINILKNPLNKP